MTRQKKNNGFSTVSRLIKVLLILLFSIVSQSSELTFSTYLYFMSKCPSYAIGCNRSIDSKNSFLLKSGCLKL